MLLAEKVTERLLPMALPRVAVRSTDTLVADSLQEVGEAVRVNEGGDSSSLMTPEKVAMVEEASGGSGSMRLALIE